VTLRRAGADCRFARLDSPDGPHARLQAARPGNKIYRPLLSLHFALPNFYFPAIAAYDILRHNGVEIGKDDFLGGF